MNLRDESISKCSDRIDANESCFHCNSDKCNDKIFPTDRLYCFQCEGEKCIHVDNSVNVRYPCTNYAKSDSCYSIFSRGKKKYVLILSVFTRSDEINKISTSNQPNNYFCFSSFD